MVYRSSPTNRHTRLEMESIRQIISKLLAKAPHDAVSGVPPAREPVCVERSEAGYKGTVGRTTHGHAPGGQIPFQRWNGFAFAPPTSR